MPDGVSPAWAPVPEIWKVIQHVLVDVSQHQLLIRAAEDGHADQPDIGMLRLWFLREWDAE